MPDHFDILSRAAAGDPEAEAIAASILLAANRQFFRCQGALSLQRCAGLPDSIAKLHRPARDFWIRVAHKHAQGATEWAKSQRLAIEVERVKSILWPRWKLLQAPPAGCSELTVALFRLCKVAAQMKPHNPLSAIPDTARQLHSIVKNSPEEISQQAA
jgi:hypothetical protein